MSTVSRIWERVYSIIESEKRNPRQPIQVPHDHVQPSAQPTRPPGAPRDKLGGVARGGEVDGVIVNQDYVSVVLNQLFLANSRAWFTDIEPTVFASTEFLYDGAVRTEPVVIGPRPNENLPRGMVMRNMSLFGPQPYRGGPFTFTFVLGQLPTGNVARHVLEVVEATSSALAPGLGVASYAKIGNAVLSGFEKLMGLSAVKPLIGLRQTINPDAGGEFRLGHWALIDADDPDPQSFWVVDGVLLHGPTQESAKPFREADFILYEFARAPGGIRNDVEALTAIQTLWKAALTAAAKGTAEAWKEAKANLVAMIGAIAISPDLTRAQGETLIDERLEQLKALHARSVRVAVAGADTPDPTAPLRRRMADLLDLP